MFKLESYIIFIIIVIQNEKQILYIFLPSIAISFSMKFYKTGPLRFRIYIRSLNTLL